MKQKQNKKFAPVLRVIVLIICGAVLGVNIYLANAKSLGRNQMPMPFGYGASVILSGSMEPEFSVGDLIIVAESETYSEGDIVVFQDKTSLIVHRIVEIDGESIITKGDANNSEDEPITADAIKGKVLFHIDGAGNVVDFLKTPVGTLIVIALAIALVEIPRRREKEADDAKKQEILEEIIRLKKEQLESLSEENKD